MNQLINFNFQGNKVRTVRISNEPYFVGKDVAEILGYSNTRDALAKHVDEEDKHGVAIRDSIGREQTAIAINESGLYSLILSSKMPNAKQFKHWVTSEVLPSIRKHGAYLTNQKAYDITHNKNALADLLLQAGTQLKEAQATIAEMKPKALFADSVSLSNTSILVGDLAKLLKQNGINIGANRLFSWLRENGYLIRQKGTSYNMPTQKSMELGLFGIKETSITHSDGRVSISKTPKVTGKGQQYFIKKFLLIEA